METLGVPLGCRAVHERVGEMIAEAEEASNDEQESGSRRPLTFRELEEVTVRACLAPVGAVPSADQVTRWFIWLYVPKDGLNAAWP